WHHLKVFGSSFGSRAELRQVLNFLESSGTKPIIDTVFPLAQAAMAQRRLAPGRHFGKIILDIDGKG
ncbi:MAG: zinc-binding dehydrogenase, partial [Candidatus Binatia bacterium]